MNKLFLLLSLALPGILSAQELSKYALAPCGSPNGLDPWLIDFKRGATWIEDRSSDTLYVAMQVHLLANDNGAGRFTPTRTLDAICRLNEDMKASGIQFFSKNDWNLIDSTYWYQHATLPIGIDMMLTNNVPDVLNCYFVKNPAGNCGYNLPYGGVALSHSCAGANDHTWAHEVGHALALPHPFFGWESKTYVYNQAIPPFLTVDYTYFHDTIDTQIPAPLDTALVEYLDGSNCTDAADLFCDTKSDFLSYRWPCDANGFSTAKQKDANGQDFYSDGTLYMSYSFDECSNRFSAEQIAAMRANLIDKKSTWLSPSAVAGPIEGVAEAISPVNGDAAPSFGAVIDWEPVPNATHYLLQVSRLSNFAGISAEAVLNGTTTYTLGQLTNNVPYYWRVRAFNVADACTGWSPAASFQSVPSLSVGQAGSRVLRCYPTLLSPGQPLTVEWGEPSETALDAVLYDALGQAVWMDKVQIKQGGQNLQFSVLLPGVYRLCLKNSSHTKLATLVIQR
jgi:hypothetical protein